MTYEEAKEIINKVEDINYRLENISEEIKYLNSSEQTIVKISTNNVFLPVKYILDDLKDYKDNLIKQKVKLMAKFDLIEGE